MTICSHSVEGPRSWYCSLDLSHRKCFGSVGDAKKGRPDFCPIYSELDEDERPIDPFSNCREDDL